MNKKIRRMKAEIERRGGKVYFDEKTPDAIAELFLKEVLACPDCMAQAQNAGGTMKPSGQRGRSSGH